MNIDFLTIKTKFGYSFLLIALVTLIYGFSNTVNLQKNDYITITIKYNFRYSINYQIIYISKKETGMENIAIIPIGTTPTQKKWSNRLQERIKEEGFKIINKNIESIYDNTPIFELLQQYEAKGWVLKSHSIGLGVADESSNERISQYLMSKKVN